MAEESEYQSIKGSSDADFEQTCTPCGVDKLREEAVKYCPECEEYLCINCTRHHARQRLTRGHVLQEKNAAKHCLPQTRIKCRYHPDRDIEMFCKTHDMVYCAMCIATEHRVCEGISKLEAVTKSKMRQEKIQELVNETKNTQRVLDDLEVKENDKLTSIEMQRNIILEKLGNTEEKLIEHIRKLKLTTEKSLNKQYASQKGIIDSRIDQVSCTRKTLNANEEQLKIIGTLGADQQFVHMVLMREAIRDAHKLQQNIEFDGAKSLELTGVAEFEKVVISEESLGKVITDRKISLPRQYRVQSNREVNVRIENDKFSSDIVDVCRLPDGQMLLADYRNKKVKQLDLNYRITNYVKVSTPLGICCINRNEVAVKLQHNVQFLSVGKTSLTKTRVISVHIREFYGITFFDDGLWIPMGYCINVYSLNGTLIRQIGNEKIFKNSLVQHMAVSGDNVIVTYCSDGAVCLNKDGTVLREIRDKRLNTTRGVCVADDGTVFLSDYTSNNVVMFTRDGRFMGEIIRRHSGMMPPLSLCYNQTNNNLIVTFHNSDKINVFKIV